MADTPGRLLDSDAAAAKVMAHARLILRLSRRFQEIAPGNLSQAAHVANVKSGKVIIHADHGAVAAKLRQLGPRLCAGLSLQGCECNGIEVKVQPSNFPLRSSSSHHKPLSSQALSSLSGAAAGLPEGTLKQALEELVARALRLE